MKVGILGAGRIATTMAKTINYVADAQAYAVASRDIEKASQFANEYGFEKAYGSYEELVEDKEVELIYVATPNNLHFEHAALCLEHGKNVLVEKPFTATGAQARKLVEIAKKNGKYLAEAMWTRYQPMVNVLKKELTDGIIGTPNMITGNLCYPITYKPRMTNLALGGGALLDLGVYPITFASIFFGDEISEVTTTCTKFETGVDSQNVISLTYTDGKMANLYSSMLVNSDRLGVISGSDGYIIVDTVNNLKKATVWSADRTPKIVKEINLPHDFNGYEYEVMSAIKNIKAGNTQAEEMPLEQSVRIIELLDKIREKWGIKFPFEEI